MQLGLVSSVMSSAYYCHLKREEEHRADAVGHLVLAAAGYRVDAFQSLLLKLHEVGGEGWSPLSFLLTHPTSCDRIKRSQQHVAWLRLKMGDRDGVEPDACRGSEEVPRP
jgi:Putative Zn-dependent protease, contains TPR repeats